MKYILKEAINQEDGGYEDLYEKHDILNYRDLANRYNKIK